MENNGNYKELWRLDEREEPENSTIPYAITIPYKGFCEPIADICAFPPNNLDHLKRMKYHGELLVNAVNSCKEINPNNPLNAAKYYKDVVSALDGCCNLFKEMKKQMPDHPIMGHFAFQLIVDTANEALRNSTK